MILPGSVLPVQTQKLRRAGTSGKSRLVRDHEVKRSLEYGEICLVYGPQSGGSLPAAGMRRAPYSFVFLVCREHVFLCAKSTKADTTLRSGASQICVKMMIKMYNC